MKNVKAVPRDKGRAEGRRNGNTGEVKGREDRKGHTHKHGERERQTDRQRLTYRERKQESGGPAMKTDRQTGIRISCRFISSFPTIPEASLLRPLLEHPV